eukprot:GHVL01038953.1.p1 GENE.GHVL01038953.1~~GHVL01038953.1.p1  ORF type:complete len:552 (+),score=210.91 GHVL01038953.1:3687-5342(+)
MKPTVLTFSGYLPLVGWASRRFGIDTQNKTKKIYNKIDKLNKNVKNYQNFLLKLYISQQYVSLQILNKKNGSYKNNISNDMINILKFCSKIMNSKFCLRILEQASGLSKNSWQLQENNCQKKDMFFTLFDPDNYKLYKKIMTDGYRFTGWISITGNLLSKYITGIYILNNKKNIYFPYGYILSCMKDSYIWIIISLIISYPKNDIFETAISILFNNETVILSDTINNNIVSDINDIVINGYTRERYLKIIYHIIKNKNNKKIIKNILIKTEGILIENIDISIIEKIIKLYTSTGIYIKNNIKYFIINKYSYIETFHKILKLLNFTVHDKYILFTGPWRILLACSIYSISNFQEHISLTDILNLTEDDEVNHLIEYFINGRRRKGEKKVRGGGGEKKRGEEWGGEEEEGGVEEEGGGEEWGGEEEEEEREKRGIREGGVRGVENESGESSTDDECDSIAVPLWNLLKNNTVEHVNLQKNDICPEVFYFDKVDLSNDGIFNWAGIWESLSQCLLERFNQGGGLKLSLVYYYVCQQQNSLFTYLCENEYGETAV